jgi:Flp pilus assembly protein CpaB
MADRNPRKFSISLGHLFLLSNLAIGILGFIYLQWAEGPSQVKLWVPKHDLPAYTKIKPTDLAEKIVPGRTISPEIVKEIDKLRDHYTLVAISQESPISKNQLGPALTSNQQTLLNNAFLVGIPATSSMTLGGNLKAGDIVDLALVPLANKDKSSSSPIMFSNIMILDIKLDASSHLLSNISLVLVVVLPLDRKKDYISNSSGAAFLITKKL